MEGVQCTFCGHSMEYCRRYSKRFAETFEVVLQEGFNQGLVVPCFIKEKLNSICGKWLVATCQGNQTYDFFLEKDVNKTTITGPYWNSLIRVYNLEAGDIISFNYLWGNEEEMLDAEEHYYGTDFDITVYQLGVNGKEEKPRFENRLGLIGMGSIVREASQRCIFSNIRDVSENEMAAINFGILKTCLLEQMQDLEDGNFYEKRSEMQFFVHRVNDENEHFQTLFVPCETVKGYKCPTEGNSLLWWRGMEEPIEGIYTMGLNNEHGEYILFNDGWDEFKTATNIVEGSLLLVKVEARAHAIGLNLVDIL